MFDVVFTALLVCALWARAGGQRSLWQVGRSLLERGRLWRVGRVGLVLVGGLWLFSCTFARVWEPGQERCALLEQAALGWHAAWKAAFVSDGRVRACLQLVWGEGPTAGRSALVELHGDGSLYAQDPSSGAFTAAPGLTHGPLPGGTTYRFRLLFFPLALPASQQESVCKTSMNAPSYECLSEGERERCLFAMEFRPQVQSGGAQAARIGGAQERQCAFFFRNAGEGVTSEPRVGEGGPEEGQRSEVASREADGGVGPEVRVEGEPVAEVPREPLGDRGGCGANQELCNGLDDNCDGTVDEGFDLQSDPEHCGQCNNACQAGRTCQAGRCGCGGGEQLCGQRCVDLSAHAAHCGGCAKMCSSGNLCRSGVCAPPVTSLLIGIGGSEPTGELWHQDVADLAVDTAGNIYLVGIFQKRLVLGGKSYAASGSTDVFVAKLSSTGQVAWVKTYGGPDIEDVAKVLVDSKGDVYVLGRFVGSVRFGSVLQKSKGAHDIFVLKLNPQGGQVWLRSAGGARAEFIRDAAFDANDQLFLIGQFLVEATFGTTKLTAPSTSSANASVFVARVNPNGTFVWAKAFGSNTRTQGWALALDGKGNLLIAGIFDGQLQIEGILLKSLGSFDYFFALLDSSGKVTRAFTAGSADSVHSLKVASDGQGGWFISGSSRGDLQLGSLRTKNANPNALDVFVARMDGKGTFVWAKMMGGKALDTFQALAVGAQGELYIGGRYQPDATFGDFLLNTPFPGLFVARVEPSGELSWILEGGSPSGVDGVQTIMMGPQGKLYVGGNFGGQVTLGGQIVKAADARDGFLWVMTP